MLPHMFLVNARLTVYLQEFVVILTISNTVDPLTHKEIALTFNPNKMEGGGLSLFFQLFANFALQSSPFLLSTP